MDHLSHYYTHELPRRFFGLLWGEREKKAKTYRDLALYLLTGAHDHQNSDCPSL